MKSEHHLIFMSFAILGFKKPLKVLGGVCVLNFQELPSPAYSKQADVGERKDAS